MTWLLVHPFDNRVRGRVGTVAETSLDHAHGGRVSLMSARPMLAQDLSQAEG